MGTVVPGVESGGRLGFLNKRRVTLRQERLRTKDRSNWTRRVGPGMSLSLVRNQRLLCLAIPVSWLRQWFSTLFPLCVYSECAVRILGLRLILAFPASTFIETRVAWCSLYKIRKSFFVLVNSLLQLTKKVDRETCAQ